MIDYDDPAPMRYGPAQMIGFTEKGGNVSERLMRPVLDEMGNWTSWVFANDSEGRQTGFCVTVASSQRDRAQAIMDADDPGRWQGVEEIVCVAVRLGLEDLESVVARRQRQRAAQEARTADKSA